MATKKAIIKVSIIIVVLGVGITVWLFYATRQQLNNDNGNSANTKARAEQITRQKKMDNDVATVVAGIAAKYKNFDGLSAEEAARYGIDPTSADSDGDGLLDRDEIHTYHTDPLNPDTSGDGYTNGFKVRHNLNPLGPPGSKLIIYSE